MNPKPLYRYCFFFRSTLCNAGWRRQHRQSSRYSDGSRCPDPVTRATVYTACRRRYSSLFSSAARTDQNAPPDRPNERTPTVNTVMTRSSSCRGRVYRFILEKKTPYFNVHSACAVSASELIKNLPLPRGNIITPDLKYRVYVRWYDAVCAPFTRS